MNNNIQIVLQILPSCTDSSRDGLIKISENYVILSSVPKSLIYQFDQVLNANTNPSLYNNYFYDYIPNSALHEVLKGNDTSVIIYNDNTTLNSKNSFNIRLIEAFAGLLEPNLDQLKLFISFFGFDQANNNYKSQRDLISSQSNQHVEYEIHSIEQLTKYFMLGMNQHKAGHLSVFSMLIRLNDHNSRVNIIDITNDSTDILNQISDYLYFSPKSVIEKSPLLQILDQSQFLYFISSLNLENEISQIQQKLSFTSNTYQRLKKKNNSVPNAIKTSLPPPKQDSIHHLKQVISRRSIETDTTLHKQHCDDKLGCASSVTSSSYYDSVFSSTSSDSTQGTPVPSQSTFSEYDKAQAWIDLNQQQTQDLQREIIIMREQKEQVERELMEMRVTNMDLWNINEAQSTLIEKLEIRLSDVEQEQGAHLSELLEGMRSLEKDKDHLLNMMKQQGDDGSLLRQLVTQKNKHLSAIQQQLELRERQARHTSSTSFVFSDQGKMMSWLQNKLDYPQEYRSDIMQAFAIMSDKVMELSLDISSLQETQCLKEHNFLVKEMKTVQKDISQITGMIQQQDELVKEEFPVSPSTITLKQYYSSIKSFQDKIKSLENEMCVRQCAFESQVYSATQNNKSLLDRITTLNNDLESEKKNNFKLSRTNHILEKRIDELITKRHNKFFCF